MIRVNSGDPLHQHSGQIVHHSAYVRGSHGLSIACRLAAQAIERPWESQVLNLACSAWRSSGDAGFPSDGSFRHSSLGYGHDASGGREELR